jgi:hypothetical protein
MQTPAHPSTSEPINGEITAFLTFATNAGSLHQDNKPVETARAICKHFHDDPHPINDKRYYHMLALVIRDRAYLQADKAKPMLRSEYLSIAYLLGSIQASKVPPPKEQNKITHAVNLAKAMQELDRSSSTYTAWHDQYQEIERPTSLYHSNEEPQVDDTEFTVLKEITQQGAEPDYLIINKTNEENGKLKNNPTCRHIGNLFYSQESFPGFFSTIPQAKTLYAQNQRYERSLAAPIKKTKNYTTYKKDFALFWDKLALGCLAMLLIFMALINVSPTIGLSEKHILMIIAKWLSLHTAPIWALGALSGIFALAAVLILVYTCNKTESLRFGRFMQKTFAGETALFLHNVKARWHHYYGLFWRNPGNCTEQKLDGFEWGPWPDEAAKKSINKKYKIQTKGFTLKALLICEASLALLLPAFAAWGSWSAASAIGYYLLICLGMNVAFLALAFLCYAVPQSKIPNAFKLLSKKYGKQFKYPLMVIAATVVMPIMNLAGFMPLPLSLPLFFGIALIGIVVAYKMGKKKIGEEEKMFKALERCLNTHHDLCEEQGCKQETTIKHTASRASSLFAPQARLVSRDRAQAATGDNTQHPPSAHD